MRKLVSNCIALLLFAAVGTTAISSCKGKPTDEQIQTAVNAKIAATPEMTGMIASVKDGVVTLDGTCKDDQCKSFGETTVKGMDGVKSVVDNCSVAPAPQVVAPVEITADDPLATSVTDAIKDFSGVKADVKDGVITLTGEIKKADLPKLMMSLNSLKPKKIDNKLTIK